jgi:hypothetical protein
MSIKDINLKIVLIVILIVMVAFFSGKYLFNIYGVKQPLKTELKNINGVKEIELIESDNKTDIKVYLKPNVNFQKTYQRITKLSGDELGKKKGDILVGTDSNSYLNDIYYQLHFAIYEGISTNKFTVLRENIEQSHNNFKFDYKLWINDNNILLRLDGKGNSLYKIISRIDRGGVNSG